jgi:hypothetical protein
MPKPLMSPIEAIDHLKTLMHINDNAKNAVFSIMKWMSEMNKILPDSDKIICYTREYKNIGFTIAQEKDKKRLPNFLVIKLDGTDIDYKYFHLDLYLSKDGYQPLESDIYQRKSNKARWILDEGAINKIGIDNLRELVKVAYKKRFNLSLQ